MYIKSMNISHYGFVCPVNLSNEKYIRVKKKKFLEIFFERQKCQVFMNYSQICVLFRSLYTSRPSGASFLITVSM